MRQMMVWVAMIALFGGAAAVLVGASQPATSEGAARMASLTEKDDGGRVSANVDEIIEIHLAENATTGYRWTPESFDKAVFELIETTADYPHGAVGSGGQAIFRFRVIGPGSGALALRNWRQWEGDASVVKRFAVTVHTGP